MRRVTLKPCCESTDKQTILELVVQITANKATGEHWLYIEDPKGGAVGIENQEGKMVVYVWPTAKAKDAMESHGDLQEPTKIICQ
jgi:penicillin V acylase-like amidase (Ntn superfamily)